MFLFWGLGLDEALFIWQVEKLDIIYARFRLGRRNEGFGKGSLSGRITSS